jgi:hypothetical protein
MLVENLKKAKSGDVIDILFCDIPVGRNVYGREDEPGVVVIRDTVTDFIYGVTIYGFSKYPDICKQSLIDLGFDSIIDQL